MEKDYILRELRKSEIKDRSGMDGTDNFANALEAFCKDSPEWSMSTEELKKEDVRHYMKEFGTVYVDNIFIRKQRAQQWLQEIYKNKPLLNKETCRKLAILLNEIDHIILDETSDNQNDSQINIQSLDDWLAQHGEEFIVFTKEYFNNKKISNLLYDCLGIINEELKNRYILDDQRGIRSIGAFVGILSINLWGFFEHIFDGTREEM